MKNISRQMDLDMLGAIRSCLLNDWDPIGVADEPRAQNEYDAYAQAILKMLKDGASESDLAERLAEIESEIMGADANMARIHQAAANMMRLVR